MEAEALVTQFNPPQRRKRLRYGTVGQNESFTFNFIKLVLDGDYDWAPHQLLGIYHQRQPDFFLAETISVSRRDILEFASLRHIIKPSWTLQIRSNMFQESNDAFSRSS